MTLPHITKQQHAILLLIYRYRFLNSIQIQRFLNHTDRRRSNSWLLYLTESTYVRRIYSKSFGENTRPAIYYIGPSGIRHLKTVEGCAPEVVRRLYREEFRSLAFIRQCQLLADAALSFGNKDTEEDRDRTYTVQTQSDLANGASKFHFLGEELKPSLLLVSKKKGTVGTYLLELFEPTLPKYSQRKRIRDYIKFCSDGDWESGTSLPFPTVLLACPTLPVLITLKRYVKRLREEDGLPEELEFWFATEEQVQRAGVRSEVWEEA